MKNIYRIIAAMAAALILLSSFACVNGDTVPETTEAPASTADEVSGTESVSGTEPVTESETTANITESAVTTEDLTTENRETEPQTETTETEAVPSEDTTEEITEEPTITTEEITTIEETEPVTTEEPEPDDSVTADKYFTYNLLSDGTYEVGAKDVNKMPIKVVFPSSYNGVPVTAIAQNSFAYCTKLKTVIIPDNILTIKNYAFFGCSNLKKVVMSEKLYLMEYGVFGKCTKLESITIPKSVSTIYSKVFSGCTALKEVIFEDPEGWSSDDNAIARSTMSNATSVAKLLKGDMLEKKLKKSVTPKVQNIRMKTVNDGITSNVLVLYCETEEYATVTVTDLLTGKILIKEKALGSFFYGMVLLPAGQTKIVSISSDAVDMPESDPIIKTLKHTSDVGYGAFIGKDSHVYLNFYDDFYYGKAGTDSNMMNSARSYLEGMLKNSIRPLTGKDTKMIIVICTNPATIYHDRQYSQAEGGRGDYYTSTPTTQFVEFMKGNDDIYVVDMRDILSKNKDRLLFMQADSHWTQIAAYYAYYLAMQKIKQDFPDMPIYDLDKDFDITYHAGGGDLLNFMGMSGYSKALTAYVSPKRDDMKVGSNAPTAYVMGDSYYWCMSNYFDYMFSEVFLNEPASNPPLYDYHMERLAERKPDYIFYVWTERNIGYDVGLSYIAQWDQ